MFMIESDSYSSFEYQGFFYKARTIRHSLKHHEYTYGDIPKSCDMTTINEGVMYDHVKYHKHTKRNC